MYDKNDNMDKKKDIPSEMFVDASFIWQNRMTR